MKATTTPTNLEQTVMGVQKLANLMLLGVPVFFALGWIAVWTNAIPEAVMGMYAGVLLLGVVVCVVGSLFLHAHARSLVRNRAKPVLVSKTGVRAQASPAVAPATLDGGERQGGVSLIEAFLYLAMFSVFSIMAVLLFGHMQEVAAKAEQQEAQQQTLGTPQP